jgi:hypothetical protein
MALPQFTGEASLYRPSKQYHMAAAPAGVLAPGIAIPHGSVLRGISAMVQPAFSINICAYCDHYPYHCSPMRACFCAGGDWNGKTCE